MVAVSGCIAEPSPTTSPQPSGGITDPTDLIECRQVPRDLCVQHALIVIEGPHPDYADGAEIERVIVTCEVLWPCAADKRDSGGRIMILYSNGWALTQDWAIGAGI